MDLTPQEARGAVLALLEAHEQFEKMSVAGYHPEVVKGIQGCADHIADRLYSSDLFPALRNYIKEQRALGVEVVYP